MATFIDDKLCSQAVAALARLANEVGTGPLIRALCRVELRAPKGSITADEIERICRVLRRVASIGSAARRRDGEHSQVARTAKPEPHDARG